MSEVERVLRAEFDAEDGSFFLQLRNLHWDRVAFSRLVEAMHTYVRELDPELPLERWAAHGFWFAENFVRDHSGHPDFPRPEPPDYYEAAIRRLGDLSYFLFEGDSPYEGNSGFEPL